MTESAVVQMKAAAPRDARANADGTIDRATGRHPIGRVSVWRTCHIVDRRFAHNCLTSGWFGLWYATCYAWG